MKREPLTTTDAHSAAPAASAASRSATRREVARAARTPARRAAQRPRPSTAPRCRAAAHSAPTSRWNAGPWSPTSPMSPSTSQRGPGSAGQHVDRGAHRVGVGVVGVVDQRDARAAPRAARELRAALDRRERLEPARDRARAGSRRRARRPPRRARCCTLCAAGDAQLQRATRRPASAASAPSASPSPHRRGRHVGRAVAARSVSIGRRPGERVPDRRVRVVGREHRRAGRAQRLDHRCRSRAPPPRRWP